MKIPLHQTPNQWRNEDLFDCNFHQFKTFSSIKRIFVTQNMFYRETFCCFDPKQCSSGEAWADAKFVGYYVIMAPVSRLLASFTLLTVTISDTGHPAIVFSD